MSPYEKSQCEGEVAGLDSRITYMSRAVGVAAERIAKLKTQELWAEIVFINAQIVEKHLKVIIAGYFSRKRILNMLEEKDIFAHVKLDAAEDEPLGYLIGVLRRSGADPAFLQLP